MKLIFLGGIFAITVFFVNVSQAHDSRGNNAYYAWEKITVPMRQYTIRAGNHFKSIKPSCALGEPYSFHFKRGNRDKLAVYYNGGGACYDDNTCVGSLQLPPPNKPVYVPSAEVANDPAQMGGILAVNNHENPYADWSMLFISYCTGDVHTGSTDTDYANPISPSLLPPQITIHHRGFDNFLYAINWLKYKHPEIKPDKLLVAGSSAGSYGSMLNLPWLTSYYPYADKVFGFSDGGLGVFKDANEFADAVFGEHSNWNIHGTLHPIFISLPEEILAAAPNFQEKFLPEVYDRLNAKYPKDKFAQYTTAYDAVQIFFWDIMLNPFTPQYWGAGLANPLFIGEWNFEMNTITAGLRASLPKSYRSYIGPGCNHTVFRHDDDFYTSSLMSSKGKTITFLEWLTAMTEEKKADKKNWQNLSCTQGVDCGEGSLTPAGIQACLDRTLGEL